MCRKPLDLATMEVDHVVPKTLLEKPTQLGTILADFELPADFDLQSFANWLPACGPCNNLKRSRVFESTPLIQLVLQNAQEKAPKAARLAAERVNDRAVSKAWNTIKRAYEPGNLNEPISEDILEFASFHAPRREPEVASEPMQLTPGIQVLSEKDNHQVPWPRASPARRGCPGRVLPPVAVEHLSTDGQGVSIRLTTAADRAGRENDGPFYASAALLRAGSALGALGEGG